MPGILLRASRDFRAGKPNELTPGLLAMAMARRQGASMLCATHLQQRTPNWHGLAHGRCLNLLGGGKVRCHWSRCDPQQLATTEGEFSPPSLRLKAERVEKVG